MGINNNKFDNKFTIRNTNDVSSQWTHTVGQVPYVLSAPIFQRNRGIQSTDGPDLTVWNDIFDIDFSTETEQDFVAGGDDSYTIDGLSFDVRNTANCQEFEINSSSGSLLMNASANANVYLSNSRTSPYISQKITNLESSYDRDLHMLRVWMHCDNPFDANFEFTSTGFSDNLLSGPTQNWFAAARRMYNTNLFGGGDNRGWVLVKGADGTIDNADTHTQSGGNDTPNVVLVEITPSTGEINYWVGDWDAGWPDISSMTQKTGTTLSVSYDEIGVFLATGTGTGNTSGAFLSQIKNARLQYKLND